MASTVSVRPETSRSAPPVGSRLGAWELGRLIGAGRLARVFEAWPAGKRTASAAAYAVKVLRDEWQDEPRAVALFRREARLGGRLSHPHVVPVLAHQLDAPPYFLAMPRLAGRTLAACLQAGGPPDLPVALWFARQVAEGLQALQATCRMMHGDVKPGNIFVGQDGHVWLIDLGLARSMDEPRALADRLVVGTMRYMAPEMVTSTLAPDIRSDIYSLGVTLYEMLTGRPSFPGDDPHQLAMLHRDIAPERLSSHAPDLPPAVVDLVHEMLAKEPLRRPQTPGELVGRLTRLEIQWFADRGFGSGS